jgi:hypothetical protein
VCKRRCSKATKSPWWDSARSGYDPAPLAGRHPRTGQEMWLPADRKPTFQSRQRLAPRRAVTTVRSGTSVWVGTVAENGGSSPILSPLASVARLRLALCSASLTEGPNLVYGTVCLVDRRIGIGVGCRGIGDHNAPNPLPRDDTGWPPPSSQNGSDNELLVCIPVRPAVYRDGQDVSRVVKPPWPSRRASCRGCDARSPQMAWKVVPAPSTMLRSRIQPRFARGLDRCRTIGSWGDRGSGRFRG